MGETRPGEYVAPLKDIRFVALHRPRPAWIGSSPCQVARASPDVNRLKGGGNSRVRCCPPLNHVGDTNGAKWGYGGFTLVASGLQGGLITSSWITAGTVSVAEAGVR